jgi:hypothetical protein
VPTAERPDLADLPALEKLNLRWNRILDLPPPAAQLRERGCVEIIEFMPDSQGYRAVRNQLVAGPRPAFVWGFSP